MRCPFCKSPETRVLETRSVDEGQAVRRRRVCDSCSKRFTTFERVESVPLSVIKKDGTTAPFLSEKILTSLEKACYKRRIPQGRLAEITKEIERSFWEEDTSEIPTRLIGERVMNALKELDQVAYVRYASVYREFADLETFMKEIKGLLDRD